MRHALLRELARFLKQALRRGRARRHAKLADEHERADLCVGLADLAREAQRLLRGVEATRWIGLREYLASVARIDASVPSRFVCCASAAARLRQSFARSRLPYSA